MQRVAMLSVHTSPLAQPGSGDAGGMNVYVHALASALARAGVGVDVLTRREHAEQPPVVVVEPGYRVMHIDAGPCAPVPRHMFPELVAPFSEAARAQLERCGTDYDLLHANYWVSGAVGHRLKHELDLPLVTTFHSLDRVHAAVGLDDEVTLRPRVEAEVVRCADLVVAATDEEREQLVRYYGADPDRVVIVPQGVDASLFSPGDQAAARRSLRLDAHPVLLFVGRIQPLKGVDLAIEALAQLHTPRATLLVVGGPSGPQGEAELARAHAWSRSSGSKDGFASFRRSRTRSSRPTTAPPTCASCRHVRSRSASSRSRPPRAAHRSSPRTSAVCASSWKTAAPDISSTDVIRSTSRRRSTESSAATRGR